MNSTLEIPIRQRNIVLIGFMGVGKTTIGQLVAKKLYRDFIDVDQAIEQTHNMTIPEIFEKYGEKHFRQLERDFIVNTCTNTRLKIISLGGGAYMQEEVRDVCLSKCIVFFLDLSWESWKDRLPLIIGNRPVLKSKSLEEIEELFLKRKEIYSINNSKFTPEGHDPNAAADEIVESIKLAWELHEPIS